MQSEQEDLKQHKLQDQFIKFNDYEKVKFTFSGLDKYIVMELNTKIALEDLKFTFANILKTDFFAKRLEFYVRDLTKEIQLKSQKPLNQQEILKGFKKAGQLGLLVKFIEEGA